MGDRPRSTSSSGLRLLLRLLSLVAAFAVLSVSGRASAATQRADASAPVPMCGEHNESIAAPPIFRAYQPGTLVGSPCQSQTGLELGSPLPLTPERVVVHERPERVLGFGALQITNSACTRLSIELAQRHLPRPGALTSLFRPPRA